MPGMPRLSALRLGLTVGQRQGQRFPQSTAQRSLHRRPEAPNAGRPIVIRHSIELPPSLEPFSRHQLPRTLAPKLLKIIHGQPKSAAIDEAAIDDNENTPSVNLTSNRVEVKRVMQLDAFQSFKTGLNRYMASHGAVFKPREGVPDSGEYFTATLGGKKYALKSKSGMGGRLQIRARKYCELSRTFNESGFAMVTQPETVESTWLEVKVRNIPANKEVQIGDSISKSRLLVPDKDLFFLFRANKANDKEAHKVAIASLYAALEHPSNDPKDGEKLIKMIEILLANDVDVIPDMMMLYRRHSVQAAVDQFSFQLTWDEDVRIYPVKNTLDKESFEPGRTRIEGGPGFPALPPGTVMVEAKIVPTLDPKIHTPAAIEMHKLLLTSMDDYASNAVGSIRRNAGKKGIFRNLISNQGVLGSTRSPQCLKPGSLSLRE